MDNEYYNSFIESSEKVINKGLPNGSFIPRDKESNYILENKVLLSNLSLSLYKSMDNLDDEIARLEKNYSSSHNSIVWANDYNDVFASLKIIFKNIKPRRVRLPNINSSTIFRELGIKYFLQDEKIELSDDADLQFFAVDMMFSDTGSLLLLNQSNNTFSKLSNTVTNIFFATINRICSNSSYAELLQQIHSYATGSARQDMVLFKTSTNCDNYLFIIDNQRTRLLSEPLLRKSLTCTHCGRCNDVCPVFQIVGEEPYNNVFSGPIANIFLPYLETFDSYRHVSYACTLCGRCEAVCPLAIPLREMIFNIRSSFLKDKIINKGYRRLLAVMRKYALNRQKLNGSRFLKRHLMMKYSSASLRKSRTMPSFASESFNKSYKKTHVNE